MTASRSTRGANERESTPKLKVYEVGNSGALRPYGAKDPEIYADIYRRIDPQCLQTIDDIVTAIGNVTPLSHQFDLRIADEHHDTVPADPQPHAALYAAWTDRLGADGIDRCRQEIAAWLSTKIDWAQAEFFPSTWGPQGDATDDFTGLSEERLIGLCVQIVYSDKPGTNDYYAALRCEVDEANSQAEQLGMGIRFVRQGESADQFLGRRAPRPPPPDPLTLELERRFIPLFGLRPDIVASVVIDPAQIRTIPPRHLQARHDRVLFQTAWDRIVKAIREPVQVWRDDHGGRHVHVLGIGVYSFHREGVVTCWLWKQDRIGKAALVSNPTDTISIDGVPWQWRWLAYWEAAFALEVENATRPRGRTAPDETVAAYARWAFKLFRNRIRSGCDLRVMRQRIARALNLDAQALAAARQINMVERRQALRASQYNGALGHVESYRKLQQDGPGLTLAYGLLSQIAGFPAEGEPLQRMRGLLLGAGLSERCWRMLVRSRSALWRPMVSFYELPGPAAALDYLRLIDSLGWRAPADPAFMRTVLSLRGGPGGERGKYAGRFANALPTLIRVVGWFERADPLGRNEILANLHKVLSWLDYRGGAQLEPLVRKPGWATLVKRAEAWWQRRLALKSTSVSAWAVPVERVCVGDYEVAFIARAEDLYDEARAMRHCVFDFVDECSKGLLMSASVRHVATDRRVATAMYAAAGKGWQLKQVAGFGNSVALAAVRDAARHAMFAVEGASRSGEAQSSPARIHKVKWGSS